jgi:sugar phosphate permease
VAEVWFPLEKRSLVIGFGFYSELIGFGLGGCIATYLAPPGAVISVDSILLTQAIIATLAFICSTFLVKNKPKVRIEK